MTTPTPTPGAMRAAEAYADSSMPGLNGHIADRAAFVDGLALCIHRRSGLTELIEACKFVLGEFENPEQTDASLRRMAHGVNLMRAALEAQ